MRVRVRATKRPSQMLHEILIVGSISKCNKNNKRKCTTPHIGVLNSSLFVHQAVNKGPCRHGVTEAIPCCSRIFQATPYFERLRFVTYPGLRIQPIGGRCCGRNHCFVTRDQCAVSLGKQEAPLSQWRREVVEVKYSAGP